MIDVVLYGKKREIFGCEGSQVEPARPSVNGRLKKR